MQTNTICCATFYVPRKDIIIILSTVTMFGKRSINKAYHTWYWRLISAKKDINLFSLVRSFDHCFEGAGSFLIYKKTFKVFTVTLYSSMKN